MDLNKLARKAQQIYVKRGGAEAAKGDASEVEEIFEGRGSFVDKAKQAAKALKEPGAHQDVAAASEPGAPESGQIPAGTPEAPTGAPPE